MLFKVLKYNDKIIINEPHSLLNLFWHLVAISFFLFFGILFIKYNLIIAILLLIPAAFFIINLIDNLFLKTLIIDFKNKEIKHKTLIPFFYKKLKENNCNKLIIYNTKDTHVGKNRVFEIKGIHIDALLKDNKLISIAAFSYNVDDHTLISINELSKDAIKLKEIFTELNFETEINLTE